MDGGEAGLNQQQLAAAIEGEEETGLVTGNHSDISRDRKAGKVVGGGN